MQICNSTATINVLFGLHRGFDPIACPTAGNYVGTNISDGGIEAIYPSVFGFMLAILMPFGVVSSLTAVVASLHNQLGNFIHRKLKFMASGACVISVFLVNNLDIPVRLKACLIVAISASKVFTRFFGMSQFATLYKSFCAAATSHDPNRIGSTAFSLRVAGIRKGYYRRFAKLQASKIAHVFSIMRSRIFSSETPAAFNVSIPQMAPLDDGLFSAFALAIPSYMPT